MVKKLLSFYLLFTFGVFAQEVNFRNISYFDSLKVDVVIDGLTLREKCAQLVMPYGYAFESPDTSKEYERLLNIVEKEKVGGILFLQGNVENLPLTISKLQRKTNIPLLIAADFENGVGGRMEEGVAFPPPMGIVATCKKSNSYLAGKITALQSRALGVHINFAPVLDIASNYKNPIINYRAFSGDHETIDEYAIPYIKGLQENGMLATAKHFPGHGATDLDSHNELPEIKFSLNHLLNNELKTFQTAIDSGVAAIMVAHLQVPALDENLPTTLSQKVIQKLLIEKMGFKGLVFSDAMNMHAITKDYSNQKAAEMAVLAGNDVVLFPPNVTEAVDGIYDAVLEGRISNERLLKSVFKIIYTKLKLGLIESENFIDPDSKSIVENKFYKRQARGIIEESILLLKEDENTYPIDTKKYNNISSVFLRQTDREYLLEKELPIRKFLQARVPNIKFEELNISSEEKEFLKTINNLKNADIILLNVFIGVQSFSGEIELNKNFKKLIQEILDLKKTLILLGFGNPFLMTNLDEKSFTTYIHSISLSDEAQAAAVRALFGEINLTGKLPVQIPKTNFQIGDGIYFFRTKLIFDKEDRDSLYNFTNLDSLVKSAITDSVFPGASIIVGHNGRVIYKKAFGNFTYSINSDKVNRNTIYDLASLTKVVATTSAVMLLYDKGKISLDDFVVDYLPEFDNNGKDEITIRNLLLHNSGLRAGKIFYDKYTTQTEVINEIMIEDLISDPGEEFLYSDLGMIVLQQVIEKIINQSLDEFIKENLFSKIDMNNTFYNPIDSVKEFIAPTEIDTYWRMKTVKGEVHDETAALLGGVSGNAGLFSNTSDLAKFVQMLLDRGIYDNKRIFRKETVDLFTSEQPNSERALGWDRKSEEGYTSAGELFSLNSFGHTGFTGTSIWVDKERKLFAILLTNRVYPSRKNQKHKEFRPKLHDEIIKTIDN